ncbi:Heparanalpha-glucosaminide N-acetyltransferase [Nesidiocoris tenuis]|uniref:Heparanalpha-glucosaminide N-acetyltransferase n=1 Tax=Nesidiocoris tenuis TaxID=355587 RepID=A0ABN7A7F9_9HEMI|nr:Heparanalpha-glucosaminide N-acetyltransferase [Nesidiocoris tenuis]
MTDNPPLCHGRQLLLDQACVEIYNADSSHSSKVYNVSSECFKCLPQLLTSLGTHESKTFVVSTVYDTVLKFQIHGKNHENAYSFGQHGHYKIAFNSSSVNFSPTSPADYVYAPLWYMLGSLLLATLLSAFLSWARTSEKVTRYLPSRFQSPNVLIEDANDDDLTGSSSRQRSGDSSPLVPTPPVDIGKDSHRTASLDVFRGITVALMIFVNNGGGGYSIFHHSPWNGLTFADVVFPWFAWIMGVSLVLSIQSQLRNTVSRPRVFVKILLRSLIIISLGIVLNSFKNNNIQRLRIPGVLQRLGLAYLIVGTIEAFLMVPQNLITVLQGRAQLVSDVIYGWKQWIIMLCLVTLHTGLVLFVKIDGCPRGYLGPGGLDRNGTAFNCTGGVTGYLDRVIFGANHIYQNPTSRHVYHSTMPFDPEGLLGTLMTAFSIFLGVNAGRVLIVYSSSIERNARWMSLSFICGILSLMLCAISKDRGVIPINKNLWSLSFVLATSSLAFVLLTVLYSIIDVRRAWNGAPFRQVGRNAIFLYVGHIITHQTFPWSWSPIDHTTHSHALWMNLWSTVLWILIAVIMERCQVFITI